MGSPTHSTNIALHEHKSSKKTFFLSFSFLDAILSEVTLMHHSIPDTLPNHSKETINFTKWRQLGRHLMSIFIIQNTPYNFVKIEVSRGCVCLHTAAAYMCHLDFLRIIRDRQNGHLPIQGLQELICL